METSLQELIDDCFIKNVLKIQGGLLDFYHDSTCEGPILMISEGIPIIRFNIKGHHGDPDHDFFVTTRSIIEANNIEKLVSKIINGNLSDNFLNYIKIKNDITSIEVDIKMLDERRADIVSGKTLRIIEDKIDKKKRSKSELESKLSILEKTIKGEK